MATLDADMTADQGYVPNVDVAPGFYQLGSELVRVSAERHSVRGLYGQPTIDGTYIDRALGGTSAAAHSSGVTFTPVGDPAAPSAGGSGVTVDNGVDAPVAVTTLVAPGAVIVDGTANLSSVLQLRLAGPYQIDWNTAGAVDPADVGLELGDELAAGSVVMPFAVVRAAFDDEATADVGIGVAPTDFISAINYELVNVTLSSFALVEAHNPDSAALLRLNMAHRVVVTGQCKLMIAIYSATGNITQGSIDIYAIIATPAA